MTARLAAVRNGLIALFLLPIVGCSTLKGGDPYTKLSGLAAMTNAAVEVVPSSPFALTSMRSGGVHSGQESITVYIEGDGLAWLNRTTPSPDPSPRSLLMAQKAVADPNGIYLARPCQFIQTKSIECGPDMWTTRRFSKEVIDSFDAALSRTKARYGNQSFKLVGYSGGAAVALALAGRRGDVSTVATIAGNVDPVKWAEYHQLSPLDGVESFETHKAALQRIPQTHFVGSGDSNVPESLVAAYKASLGGLCVDIKVVPGATHTQRWDSVTTEKLNAQPVCGR